VGTTGRLREVSKGDAQVVFDLVVRSDIVEYGKPSVTMAEVRDDLSDRHLHGIALDGTGDGPDLDGWAWILHKPGHSMVYGDMVIRPGADDALASVLMGWIQAKSQEVAPGLPRHLFADSKNVVKHQEYEKAGGTVIRRYYRMAVTLGDEPPQVPALAEGVEIRPVEKTDDDLRTMHAIVDTAFLDHFAHEPESYELWAEQTVESHMLDMSLWWLATVDGVPAAGVHGVVLPDAGHVDVLGTLREYRGRGLARALLLTSFAEHHRRGLRKSVLGVDATNPTGALALYESAGMYAEHEGWRYELR
jgi:mycothiol synthase